MDCTSDFFDELKNFGFKINSPQEGKINRCSTNTSKSGEKPAWFLYKNHEGKCFGVFGDFRKEGTLYYPEFIDKNQKKDLITSINSEEDSDVISLIFNHKYNLCEEVKNHDYLEKKQINLESVKGKIKSKNNCLVIPVYNIKEQLVGLQYIDREGKKKFESGSKCKESFFKFEGDNKEKIVICEGFATGYSIFKSLCCIVIVTFSAGNVYPVSISLKEKYPNTTFVVAADNDKAGLDASEKVRKEINCQVAKPEKEKEDFNDVYCNEGIQKIKDLFLSFTPLFQFGIKCRQTHWLLENYIQLDSNFCIFGKPGSGKSFLALYLILAVANNDYFFGSKPLIEDGYVLYICGEDFSYINIRAKAFCEEYGWSDEKFIITTSPVHLLDNTQVDELIRNIEALKSMGGFLKMVIIDTLNANFGDGNENDTRDMTRIGNACQRIRATEERTVIGIVHHSGKENEDSPRGNSALFGNVASMWKVGKDINDDVWVSCYKSKNAKQFEPISGKIVTKYVDVDGAKINTAFFREEKNLNINESEINSVNQLVEKNSFNKKTYDEIFCAIQQECVKKTSNKIRKDRCIDIIKIWNVSYPEEYIAKFVENKKLLFLNDGSLLLK